MELFARRFKCAWFQGKKISNKPHPIETFSLKGAIVPIYSLSFKLHRRAYFVSWGKCVCASEGPSSLHSSREKMRVSRKKVWKRENWPPRCCPETCEKYEEFQWDIFITPNATYYRINHLLYHPVASHSILVLVYFDHNYQTLELFQLKVRNGINESL